VRLICLCFKPLMDSPSFICVYPKFWVPKITFFELCICSPRFFCCSYTPVIAPHSESCNNSDHFTGGPFYFLFFISSGDTTSEDASAVKCSYTSHPSACVWAGECCAWRHPNAGLVSPRKPREPQTSFPQTPPPFLCKRLGSF
jgi:hypothetical protein